MDAEEKFLVIFGISRANWKQLKDITHLINASLICHVSFPPLMMLLLVASV